jgi:cobalt-zinc-cadmium efflux system outer membrane protein
VPHSARTIASTGAYPIDQLVELADRHNIAVLAANEALKAAQAQVAVASVLPNPRIELGLGAQSLRSSLTDASGRINSLGVSQLVENPALREARIRGFLSLERSQQAQVRGTRTVVAGEVRRLAYEVLLRGEEVQAALDARNLLSQIRERVRVRVESGEAARYELIKADAEVIGSEQRQKVASLELEQARIRLQQVVGMPLVLGWSVAGSLDDPVRIGERSRLRASIPTQHPDLVALRAVAQAAEQRIREAQASRYPGVDLQLSQTREAPANQPALRETLLGASLSVPLLDSRRAAVDLARAELRRVEAELFGREQLLLREFDTALAALDIAQARVTSLAEGAIRQAEAALRVAEAAYRFGERGILEVIDAQRVLRAVRADLLLAKFEQQSAANTIQILTQPITSPAEQRR